MNYWTYLSQTSIISNLLDPSTKFETFNEKDRQLAINHLKVTYLAYHTNDMVLTLKQEDELKLIQSNRNEENKTTNELATYLFLLPEPNTNPLLWWKMNALHFPTIALMAADYFALQATSVPCEHAFSAAKNTLHLQRNSRLICLKSWLEADILK